MPTRDRPTKDIVAMVDRSKRLAQFTSDRHPEVAIAVEIICEDHNGTYTPPFRCLWTGTGWISATTSTPIDARVLGWRHPLAHLGPRRPFWAHRLSSLHAKR